MRLKELPVVSHDTSRTTGISTLRPVVLTSLTSEAKRWAWQLLMAFASPFYVLSIAWVVNLLGVFIPFGNPFSFDTVFYYPIWIGCVPYYALSAYVHYVKDKKKEFRYLFLISFRMWGFFLLATHLVFCMYFLEGGPKRCKDEQALLATYCNLLTERYQGTDWIQWSIWANVFLIFPLASIFFTWWLSELYVRFERWQASSSHGGKKS
jgi:hypothetical protein